MARTFVLSINNWNILRDKIIEDYGQATVLVSWRLKRTLGFTVREHSYVSSDSGGYWDRFTDIRLDFWDDYLQTMFLIKYGDYVSEVDLHA